MTLKSAGLLLGFLLVTATGATAAPLSHVDGLADGASFAQPVRHRYYNRRFYRSRYHNGTFSRFGCPYHYEPTFWGSWRLVSPCSNNAITHAY